VNYSNQLFVEPPVEYEHRLKAYVGKGNNSCMVAGLISRRIWFSFTDKIEEANFVWTQLKQLSFFKRQSNFSGELPTERKGKYRLSSIWTDADENAFRDYFNIYFSSEERADERMLPRSKYFKYRKMIKAADIRELKMQNHLINNYVLGNKKALFNTMANYYQDKDQNVFSYLPLTFHIQNGLEDTKYF
jgi:tubulin---tyrosine ligase